ncbi:clip-associating protein 2-like [Limosa lapponica baueri]|uniref:Clip-associating protein 2-like n=1 Tax=Limosa lapponica baueri TaxID=1758121 RepID=A0A2I0SZS7_LIMLA|nr:clip-associating protein 2-like [Limosa lapponica baueri]
MYVSEGIYTKLHILQLKKVRSLLVAGAAQYDGFFQHLRLLDGAFKLSAKDLRSQVVREACITVAQDYLVGLLFTMTDRVKSASEAVEKKKRLKESVLLGDICS